MKTSDEIPENQTTFIKQKELNYTALTETFQSWKKIWGKIPADNIGKWVESLPAENKTLDSVHKTMMNIRRQISKICKPKTKWLEIMIDVMNEILDMILQKRNISWVLKAVNQIVLFVEFETDYTGNLYKFNLTKKSWMELTKKVIPAETIEFFDSLLTKAAKEEIDDDHMGLKMSTMYVIEKMGLDKWDMCYNDSNVKEKTIKMLKSWMSDMIVLKNRKIENVIYVECVNSIIRYLKVFIVELNDSVTSRIKKIIINIISGDYFEMRGGTHYEKNIYHIFSNLINSDMAHDWLHYRDYFSTDDAYGKNHRIRGLNAYVSPENNKDRYLPVIDYIEMMSSDSPRAIHSKMGKTTGDVSFDNKEEKNTRNMVFGWVPHWFLKHPSLAIYYVIQSFKDGNTSKSEYREIGSKVMQNLQKYPGDTWFDLYFPGTSRANNLPPISVYEKILKVFENNLENIIRSVYQYIYNYNSILKQRTAVDKKYIISYKFDIVGKDHSVKRLMDLIDFVRPLTEDENDDMIFFCKTIVHNHMTTILSQSILNPAKYKWRETMNILGRTICAELFKDVNNILYSSLRKLVPEIPDVQSVEEKELHRHIRIEKQTTISQVAEGFISLFMENIDFGLKTYTKDRFKEIKRKMIVNNIHVIRNMVLKKMGYYPFIGLFTIVLQQHVCFLAQMMTPFIVSVIKGDDNNVVFVEKIQKGLMNFIFETLFTKITLMSGLAQPLEFYSIIIPMVNSGRFFGLVQRNTHINHTTSNLQYKQNPLYRYTLDDIGKVIIELQSISNRLEQAVHQIDEYASSKQWFDDSIKIEPPSILTSLTHICSEYRTIEHSIDGIDDDNPTKKHTSFYTCKLLIEKCDAYVYTIHHIMDRFSTVLSAKYSKIHSMINIEIYNIQSQKSNYGYLRSIAAKNDIGYNLVYGSVGSGGAHFVFDYAEIDEILSNYLDLLITQNKTKYPETIYNVHDIFGVIIKIMSISSVRNSANIYNSSNYGQSMIDHWKKIIVETVPGVNLSIRKSLNEGKLRFKGGKNYRERTLKRRNTIIVWWNSLSKYLFSPDQGSIENEKHPLYNPLPAVTKYIKPDTMNIIMFLCWWKERIRDFFNKQQNFFIWLSEFINWYLKSKTDLNVTDPSFYDFFSTGSHGSDQDNIKVGVLVGAFTSPSFSDDFLVFNGLQIANNDILKSFVISLCSEYINIFRIIEKVHKGEKTGNALDELNLDKYYPDASVYVVTKHETRIYWDLVRYLSLHKGYIHPIILRISYNRIIQKLPSKIQEKGLDLQLMWSKYMNFMDLYSTLKTNLKEFYKNFESLPAEVGGSV